MDKLLAISLSDLAPEMTVHAVRGGKVASVGYSWHAKDATRLPGDWWQTVVAELSEQESVQLAKDTGRWVP